MPLPPAFKPLSASMIMAEADQSITAVAALTGNSTSTPAEGSMVKLYENALSTPVNQTAPHAYSEFYGKYFGRRDICRAPAGALQISPSGGTPQSLSPSSLATNKAQISPNTIYMTESNGADKFGTGQLWYEISGSGGLGTNRNWTQGSSIVTFRNSDLAYDFDFADVDNNPGGIYSFDVEDTNYIAPRVDYTASFPTGTNVTCSAAIYSEASPNQNAPTGLASSGWVLIDPQDSQFKSNNGVESPDHAGEWHVTVEGETAFYTTFAPVFAKIAIADGFTTP